MKNLLHATLTVLLATVLISAVPTDAEAKIYDDTLRLHILANSDSKEDQELKLKIRDRLLSKYGDKLRDCDSITAAISGADSLLPSMEADTKSWISELGYDYSVRITLTEEWYDTRDYENFTLPKGLYTSLRVIIGEGDGKNWWCVMYPPMCLELACENAPSDDGVINYTNEELKLINDGKYNVKFKILELLSGAFTKNG